MPRSRLLVPLLAIAVAVLLVPAAGGSGSAGVLVSQVFGGGGNVGSPYANDFVELFNRGSTPVSLSGWTLQYATAAGTSWQATPLDGSIQPGGRYLVQLAGGAEGAPLPAPDATGTTNASSTNGKIAVVRDAAPLTCGAAPGGCAASGLVEDLVGYGSASDYEGSGAAPALTSTAAAVRAGDGCADTDSNAADFSAAPAAPRNSAVPAQPCASAPPSGASATAAATVALDVQPVLSIALERPSLAFGATTSGGTPAPISERVTVLSNHAAGYTLGAHRSPFAPEDLPLALQATAAPPGGVLGPAVAGGSLVPIPLAPATLTIGTTSSRSAAEGDVWPTNIGFGAPIPAVNPGRYTATLTVTVIAR